MARILILEDEDSVNRGISFSLEKEGHKVVSCGTILEAKQQAAQSKPENLTEMIPCLFFVM